eukprot:2982415-Lingulodinium_polyedra.AAC.1
MLAASHLLAAGRIHSRGSRAFRAFLQRPARSRRRGVAVVPVGAAARVGVRGVRGVTTPSPETGRQRAFGTGVRVGVVGCPAFRA